jgi:hypothetical protein
MAPRDEAGSHTSIAWEAGMSVWDFDHLAPVLNAVGMASARDEPLDLDALAVERGESRAAIEMLVDQIDRMGLIVAPLAEPEFPPALTRAGSQYLEFKGKVPDETLHFLPKTIDDLYARRALLHGGTVLVDEFRYQVAHGRAVFHAQGLVPDAFTRAVDGAMAINLFAAAVSLMARLSCDHPAGCLAEEILAVTLLDNAAVWIEMETEKGNVTAEDAQPALAALRGIFNLFEDDDVLKLFEMDEPSDAALAGHSLINRQMGVVDQRVESWFRPFGPVPETGYLEGERTPSISAKPEAPLVEVEPGESPKLDRADGPGKFRVIVRLWEDDFLDRHPASQMAATWIYYVDAAGAGGAMEEVRRRFPDGSDDGFALDLIDSATLDREDLARISVDVQRVGLPQEFSAGRSFHVAGELNGIDGIERLGQLAATFADAFPAAVVMSDGQKAYFAVSMNAESHEEADANLDELFAAFGDAVGLDDHPVDGSTLSQGERSSDGLIEDIESYRRGQ